MNRSLLFKTLTVGALALVLMIPVGMIQNLVAERQQRKNEAVAGIAEGWGKRQTVAAPAIVVPYERHWTEIKVETIDGKQRETRVEKVESRVLKYYPQSLQWSGAAEVSEKARGIYRARLYAIQLEAKGTFDLPARASAEDGKSRYRWFAPRLELGVSDPRGIRVAAGATVEGKQYAFAPGAGDGAGLHSPLRDLAFGDARQIAFSLALELAGSEAFALVPPRADTSFTLRADWPHPSFQGRFLPATHDIRADGFTASWRISRLATQGGPAEQIVVSFIEPAGLYQQLERASKYGFLFLGLTFAAFMLFEIARRLAIHPIQYALVGLALAMFFLLLTALSEHIDFALAYAIATAACVGVITMYLIYVLRSSYLALAFSASLACLYGILFALLKAEDYALLGGSIVLFLLLAAVMLATRRLDWYQLQKGNAHA
jgi:inner membrane protein